MARALVVTLILLFCASVILAIRGGATFPLPQVLPGLGGPKPMLYELGGAAMLIIAAIGVARWLRRRDDE